MSSGYCVVLALVFLFQCLISYLFKCVFSFLSTSINHLLVAANIIWIIIKSFFGFKAYNSFKKLTIKRIHLNLKVTTVLFLFFIIFKTMSMFRNFVLTAFVADVSAIQDNWTDAIDQRWANRAPTPLTSEQILEKNVETYKQHKSIAKSALEEYDQGGSLVKLFLPNLESYAKAAKWEHDRELIKEVSQLRAEKQQEEERIRKVSQEAAEQRRVAAVSVEKGAVTDTQYYNVRVTRTDGEEMEFGVRYSQVRAAYYAARAKGIMNTAISRKHFFTSSSNEAVFAERKANFELVIPEICRYIQDSFSPYRYGWDVVADHLNKDLIAFLTKN
jgi:hypothetical protein